MSIPSLRQPKIFAQNSQEYEHKNKPVLPDMQYVILTLKNEKKLVVSSDAYNGMITVGDMYRCVFCKNEMKLDFKIKERHICCPNHKKMHEKYPHVEEYGENLIRELTKSTSFCTICNVVVSNLHLRRHVNAEVHIGELEKAFLRSSTYKPY